MPDVPWKDEDVSGGEAAASMSSCWIDRNVRNERIGIIHASGSIASISRVRPFDLWVCACYAWQVPRCPIELTASARAPGHRFFTLRSRSESSRSPSLTIEGVHAVQFAGYSRVNGAVQHDPTYVSWVLSLSTHRRRVLRRRHDDGGGKAREPHGAMGLCRRACSLRRFSSGWPRARSTASITTRLPPS